MKPYTFRTTLRAYIENEVWFDIWLKFGGQEMNLKVRTEHENTK